MLSVLAASQARAVQFNLNDDWSAGIDTTLSYGASYRVEGQDKKLIAKANGGGGNNSALINSDDGNLNFKKGELFSEVVKVVSEMDLNYQERYGLFVRGRAFHDFELNDDGRRHRELSDDAKDEVGQGAELLDAFVYGSWEIDERALNVRLGRQVINWGEGLFYQNGIAATNPVDITALRAPGSEVKEAFMPTLMGYVSYELRDNLSIEGYWQPSSAWEESKVDPCGTYYSTLDVIGEGCDYLSVAALQEAATGLLGTKRAFDNPADAQAFANGIPPIGMLGVVRNYLPTTFIPRGRDIEPHSDQWGVALRWFAPELNDTEFGLYHLRYNMQVPMLGLTVGRPMGPLPGVGFLPVANTSEYYAEYLEDRSLYGVSFNTTIGGDSIFNGLSLAGELSYRPDTPIALGLGEYANTALLGNLQGIPVGTRIDGYREKDMYQASLVGIYNFNGLLGSDSASLMTEIVASRVQDLESDIDYYEATNSAYGAQTLLSLTYPNVFNLFNLVPSVGYQYSINGVAPQLTNGLDEEAQSYSIGVDAIYQESLTVGAKFVGYSGGGLSNKRTDRDFVSLSVKYSF
jgi:hypothetical protein